LRLLFALSLLLAACSSLSPQSQGCKDVNYDCGGETLVASHSHGLDASNTVQKALFPTLIGGKPAEPSDWPASVYASSSVGSCSATVIGDRAVIMAAHCMSDGGKITFSAGVNKYSAVCAHNPDYQGMPDQTADWALCFVDRPVIGVPFENLGVNLVLKMGQTITLTGYGCITIGGGGGNDGIFRVGTATVQALPGSKSHDIVTLGGAALCYGDSGGSAYVVNADGSRSIAGINSRGNIKDTSYLVVVSAKSFIDWANEWAKDSSNVRICGLHSDAVGCRKSDAAPHPDSKISVTGTAGCFKGVLQPGFVDQKDSIAKKVEDILNNPSGEK
jgi:hypothetical protein